MIDFLKRNKAWVGLALGLAGTYILTQSCPGLSETTCTTLKVALSSVTSFLIGAGVLPSDTREKFVQVKAESGTEIAKAKTGVE